MNSIILAISFLFLPAIAHAEETFVPTKVPVKTGYKKVDLEADTQPVTKEKDSPAIKFNQSCQNTNGVQLFENDPGFEACTFERQRQNRSGVDSTKKN